MLNNINIEEILFLDIETTPQYPEYQEMPERFQNLWDKKSKQFRAEDDSAEDVYERAGIYSEFGKIVCISVGKVYQRMGEFHLRLKSYYGHNEKSLLQDFSNMLDTTSQRGMLRLCAHNGQEFDFPYIARRCLVNGIEIPKLLDVAGAKPWDVRETLLDTLQLWKFGDYKHYTSLELLCAIFEIPTPKDDIDGSQVASVYWKENDVDRIAFYCEKDVQALTQLFLKYQGKPLISQDYIERV